MDDPTPPDELLAHRLEAERPRLVGLALRMLGSVGEAEDAVQEAWLRLARADATQIDNLPGWLTTVVSRICLDALRSRGSRREDALDEADGVGRDRATHALAPDPVEEALAADAVGEAMLVVLDTLAPAERLAFVLHDVFGLPFDELGTIMGRSVEATRQLASRGRRRVRTPGDAAYGADVAAHRSVVEAFLAASKSGDFGALLELLDPAAQVRSDAVMAAATGSGLVVGAEAVAQSFSGRARAARSVVLDGYAAAAWSYLGEVRAVFAFTVVDGRVREIELIGDPEVLGRLDLTTRKGRSLRVTSG